ncbi:nonstructural protein [Chicken microvirus mg4_115]|nr:nonstructural protein [Chicken microvirus mg4_115]
MTKYLYAIHDKLAGIYSAPFALNPKTAQRTFDFMAKERNEQDCKDQRIVYLGMYDDETGTIVMTDTITEVYDLEKEWGRKHEN